MPNGRMILTTQDQRGEDDARVPTGTDLQTGRSPHGAKRRFQGNDRGLIGPDDNTFPTTLSGAFIAHRAVIRSPQGTVVRAGPTIDDTAYIPSFAVGDPSY